MNVLVVHGPNLNLLGMREPEVYGTQTLSELNEAIEKAAAEIGLSLEIHQSAREGDIVELLHAGIGRVAGAVVNPAAYSHTSRAIAEAIRGVDYPVIEVHLSNIHAREPWRRASVTAEAAAAVIAGLGADSYILALRALKQMTEA